MGANQPTTENLEKKLDELKESTVAILSRFKEHSQPFSIFEVREELRKGNEHFYTPKSVSVGPRHRGTKTDLLLTETTKWRCTLSLLHRGQQEGTTAQKDLDECLDVLSELEKEVRASYVDDFRMNWKDELAKIMLCDACFLLELFISGSEEWNEQRLKSRLEPPRPGTKFGKKPEVLTDLMMLDNQIPLVIIRKLSNKLFGEGFVPIETLALNLYGYFPDEGYQPSASSHLLELVHSYICEKQKPKENQQSHQDDGSVAVDIRSSLQAKLKRCVASSHLLELVHSYICEESHDEKKKLKENQESDQDDGSIAIHIGSLQAKLNRCGPILEGVGVKIRPRETQSKAPGCSEAERGFNFDIEFSNGKLEIPPLRITKETEARWRNLIAWEQGHTGFDYKHKCTSAALLFNGLICCEKDVQLLKDKGIIDDGLKKSNLFNDLIDLICCKKDVDQLPKDRNDLTKSNRELLEFFRSIIKGVDLSKVNDSSYDEMVKELNEYPPKCRAKQFLVMLWHTWLPKLVSEIGKFLWGSYNFMLTAISLLTIVQTYYAVVSYHYPKN